MQKYANCSLCQSTEVATSNKGNPLNANFVSSIPVWLNLGETLYGVLRTEYYSISLRSTYIEHLDSNSISVLVRQLDLFHW